MRKNNIGQTGGFVALFFVMFIVVIVGTALLNPIASNTEIAKNTTGISGTAAATILDLNTLMYVLAILAAVAGLAFLGLRAWGMI